MNSKSNNLNPAALVVLSVLALLVGIAVYSQFQSSPDAERIQRATSELDKSLAAICESKSNQQEKEACWEGISK